jgi:hypothetical protein
MRTHPCVAIPALTLALLLGTAEPGQAQPQEKGARDFAKLMPANSLVYAEINYPKMTREVLTLIKSSALNDYAAFRDDLYKRLKIDGGNQGFSLPPTAYQALVLTPEFLDELGRINGVAVAITGVQKGRNGPEPSYVWAIDPGTSNIVPLIVRDICTFSSSMRSVRTVEGVRVNRWFQLDKRIEEARENIQKIQGAAKSYLREHEKLDSLEDLVTSNPPLVRDKQVLIDPWGKPYRFEVKDSRATVWSDSPMGKITSTAGPEKAKYEPLGPVLAVMPGLILVGSDADIVSDVIRREKGMHEKVAAPILADLPEFQQYADVRKQRQLFYFVNLARVESMVKADPVASAAMVEARTLLGLDSCKEVAVGVWLENSNPHLELVARHDARTPTPLARMLSTRTIDPRVLHFVPDDAFITVTAPLFKEPGDHARFLESLQVVAAHTRHSGNAKKAENPLQHLIGQIRIGLATPQGKELASSIHSLTLAALPGTRGGVDATGVLDLKDEATAKSFMDLAPVLFGKGEKARVQEIGKYTIHTVPVDDNALETDLWGGRALWYWGDQSYGRAGNIVVLGPSPELVARVLEGGATRGGFAGQPDVAKALTQVKDVNGLVVWSGRNLVKAGLKEAEGLGAEATRTITDAASAEAALGEALKKQNLDDQLRFTRPPLPTLDQELLRHYPQQLKKITADLSNVMRDLPAGSLIAISKPDRLTISGSQPGLQLALPRLIDAIVEWDLSRPNLAKLKQNLERGRFELRPDLRGDPEDFPVPSSQEPPKPSTPSTGPRPGPGGPPPKSPPEREKPKEESRPGSTGTAPDRPEARDPESYRLFQPSDMFPRPMLDTLPVPEEFFAARDRVKLHRLPAQDYDKEIGQTRSRIEELKKGSGEDTAKSKEEIKRLEDYVKSLQDYRHAATERDNQLKSLRARLAELKPSSEKLSNEIALHRKRIDELEEPLKKAEADLREATTKFDSFAKGLNQKKLDFKLWLSDQHPNADWFDGPHGRPSFADAPIDYGFRKDAKEKADERTARVRWEYKVMTTAEVRSLGKADLGAGLNRLGDDGWELVGIDKNRYALKRSK